VESIRSEILEIQAILIALISFAPDQMDQIAGDERAFRTPSQRAGSLPVIPDIMPA
jgi:hypothetical protein